MSPDTAQIVVGYDRDDPSQRAVRTAADLATSLDAHLHVVHVVNLLDYPVDPDSARWKQEASATLEHERNRVRELLRDRTVAWTYHAEHGDPVRALTNIADRLDALMVVVATRGEGVGAGLQRLLGGGSVGHGLVAGIRSHVDAEDLSSPQVALAHGLTVDGLHIESALDLSREDEVQAVADTVDLGAVVISALPADVDEQRWRMVAALYDRLSRDTPDSGPVRSLPRTRFCERSWRSPGR